MNIANKVIQFERGEMKEKEIITFFQELIDSDMAWTLQGSYGRLAKDLIALGHCRAKNG